MPAHLGGGNLDGQRDAIQIRANPLDDFKLIRCRLKASICQSSPFYKQANGDRLVMRAGIQRRDLVDCLTLYLQYASAGIDYEKVTAGRTKLRDCICNWVEHVLAVIHEQDRR